MTIFYYLDGTTSVADHRKILHREDGPAVHSDNYKAWWLNGKRHREDGPAVEWTNGDEEWWINGKRHRKDGPAIEYKNGYKAWWIDDKLHREDGPAMIIPNNRRSWYINGEYIESSLVKKLLNYKCKSSLIPYLLSSNLATRFLAEKRLKQLELSQNDL